MIIEWFTYSYTKAKFLAKTIQPFIGLLKIENDEHDHVAYSIGVCSFYFIFNVLQKYLNVAVKFRGNLKILKIRC